MSNTNKFYELWEPVVKSFERNYEYMCCMFKQPCAEIVDWHPSGYLELTAKMSDGKILVYEFIGDRIYPTKDNLSWMLEPHAADNEQEWRENFAANLRRRLRTKCISRNTLSELTGISTVTLSSYLMQQSTPSAYNLEKICAALECSVADLTHIR